MKKNKKSTSSIQKFNRAIGTPAFCLLEFFMLDLVNNCVYQMPYPNMQELKHRITAAIHSIAPIDACKHRCEIECLLDIQHVTKGSHMDIY
ncbi:hypothetical protein AVEN_93799-1 [Araneus ventricosus]|uniref:Uncharacterized protein n=1 Tax=Araneus ventricosus TaxID=182803 RepID=A0A4Y2B089_ARAVE|nr:hypothetical protein AVEN_93799-1 [Araneus ventricosus]